MGGGRGQRRSERRLSRLGWAASAILIVALVAGAFFGVRTFGTYRLLHSATQTGVPGTSGIRPWMTLGYVAENYDVAFITLVSRLRLSPDTDPKSTLKDLADGISLSRIEFTQRVQRAIADTAQISEITSFFGMVDDPERQHFVAGFDIWIHSLRCDFVACRTGVSIAKRGRSYHRRIASGTGKT